ncbi:MAG: hypothetical protein ACJA0Q_000740 [Saprospiraceae bacterium]|jgi:hypothetical protein
MKNKKITISLTAILFMFFTFKMFFWNKPVEKENLPEVTIAQNYVSPPFSGVDIPRTYFDIDAGKDTVISFDQTKIRIPSCAFIDGQGEVVKGKVRLSYREASTRIAIMISGVPMQVEEGKEGVLESVGMFEMLAYQQGELLKPNPNCGIDVAMKSNNKDDDYNLYSLDTVNKKWGEVAQKIPVIFPKSKTVDFQKLAAAVGIVNPIKPLKANPKLYQFNFKMDFSKYPELNIFNGVKWEFVGRKKSENPEKNPWVKTAYWNEMEIVKRKRNGVYKLKLTSNGKVFKTTVKPVFSGEDMEYAEFVYNEKYKKYRGFVQKKKAELARAKKRREVNELVTREITVQGFGWVNIDRVMKTEQLVLDLKFDDKNGESKKVSKVFLVMEGINSVITYRGDLSKFKYGKNKDNKLVVIDENADVFLVSNEAFKKISPSATSHVFTLKNAVEINSEKDVLAMLGE